MKKFIDPKMVIIAIENDDIMTASPSINNEVGAPSEAKRGMMDLLWDEEEDF